MHSLNEQGFTIVEIITGLVLMVMFIVGMAISIDSLTYINDRAYDQVLINGLAEEKIESLRSAGFVALSDGTYDFTDELPASIGAPKTASYTIDTSPHPDTGSAVKDVVVTITYADGRTAQTASFHTKLGELGIGQ